MASGTCPQSLSPVIRVSTNSASSTEGSLPLGIRSEATSVRSTMVAAASTAAVLLPGAWSRCDGGDFKAGSVPSVKGRETSEGVAGGSVGILRRAVVRWGLPLAKMHVTYRLLTLHGTFPNCFASRPVTTLAARHSARYNRSVMTGSRINHPAWFWPMLRDACE